MTWLSIAIETDCQHAEALADALRQRLEEHTETEEAGA